MEIDEEMGRTYRGEEDQGLLQVSKADDGLLVDTAREITDEWVEILDEPVSKERVDDESLDVLGSLETQAVHLRARRTGYGASDGPIHGNLGVGSGLIFAVATQRRSKTAVGSLISLTTTTTAS